MATKFPRLHTFDSIYLNTDWESYCGFDLNLRDGKLACKCGEDGAELEWTWETDNSPGVLSIDDKEILFHPIYSPGTAAVRGSKQFENNVHYYWEIKILTKLYGTDVMIGIGTADVPLHEDVYKFISLLGNCDQSWGYSYKGNICHNKLSREYGPSFGLGTIVGVHLDMYDGTLEYYINRKPIGVAFRGLKGKRLYPMISSTAAQSVLKLITAYSFSNTLEMKCLKVIKNNLCLTKQFYSIPGLSRLIRTNHFCRLPDANASFKEENVTLKLEDEAVLPTEVIEEESRRTKRQRIERFSWQSAPMADPDHVNFRWTINDGPTGRYYARSVHPCTLKLDRRPGLGEVKSWILNDDEN